MSKALMLDQKLRAQVQTERKITHEILLTIWEIDITGIFRELGHSSLYDYLVRGLRYSEGAANRRIAATRLLKQCPEIAPKIQEGKINLSQLALVQSAIKQEERKSPTKVSNKQKQETLKALEGKSHFETQKVLIETFQNFEVPKPKVRPCKNKKIQVTLEFDENDWKQIKGLLAHMSHKIPDQKIESALIYWAKEIEKKKAKVVTTEVISQVKQVTSSVKLPAKQAIVPITSQGKLEEKPTESAIATAITNNPPPIRRRKYISVKIKNEIFKKANHQCEYVSSLTNQRCGSQHFLDTEHRMPLALGGTDNIENLRVMCRSHNHLMAKQMHL